MTQFQPGDRVRHELKPEWGLGRVECAERITHEGRAAQKVIVTFPDHGRVALHTAIAPLKAAKRIEPDTAQDDHATMKTLQTSQILGALKALPEATTDLLSSLCARLEATLKLYGYSTGPRALLDWACTQTGLEDPLSHMTRHELEDAFNAFAQARDRHLRELLRTAKKSGRRELIDKALGDPLPAARAAAARAVKMI